MKIREYKILSDNDLENLAMQVNGLIEEEPDWQPHGSLFFSEADLTYIQVMVLIIP